MTTSLEGIRVLEWGHWQQGPVAARTLGDLGAEVIKIEDRIDGDPARGLARVVGASTNVYGRNCIFEHHNRNKKSITLDLKKEKGREILYRLVEKSDVFLHNMRQGVPERLGLDYETLYKYNPRLIYAIGSSLGPNGPDSGKPCFDVSGQARSGMMITAAEPGMPPRPIQVGVGDQLGGLMTAFAVVTALLTRERQGIGQKVEASLLGSLTNLLSVNIEFKLVMGQEISPFVRTKAGNPLWNYYRCKDDKWIVLTHLQPDRHWPSLCQVLCLENLEKEDKYCTMEMRSQNAAELISILDSVFLTKNRSEWLEILKKSGDLIFESVNSISDVVEDPQMRDNDYIVDYEHPSLGKVTVTGSPMHFSQTPATIRLPAPEFGQHTEEVLQNILGFTWEEIAKLREDEII